MFFFVNKTVSFLLFYVFNVGLCKGSIFSIYTKTKRNVSCEKSFHIWTKFAIFAWLLANDMIVDKIDGVKITPLKIIRTEKGNVLRAMRATDKDFQGFGEAYFSEIHSGECKGWKRHNRITLNIIAVKGAIRFTIYDDRNNSRTKDCFYQVTLSPEAVSADEWEAMDDCRQAETLKTGRVYARLTIDPGLWVAFEGVDKNTSMLMDIIPEIHDPSESDRRDYHTIQIK